MRRIVEVEFDLTNKEHQRAFAYLTQFNRQHPTLRFILEEPYVDIRSMLLGKVAKWFSTEMNVMDDVRETLGFD